MLLLSVLLTCVAFVTTATLSPKHIKLINELILKERELEAFNQTNNDDQNVKRLEQEVRKLEDRVIEELGLDKCRRTYRCDSADYVPGCGCWAYVKEQVNGTTIYKFNKFHLFGVETVAVGEDDELLKTCDKKYFPDGNYNWFRPQYAGIIEFTHCVRDGRLECFCSSQKPQEIHCEDEVLPPARWFSDYVYSDTVKTNNGTVVMYNFKDTVRSTKCLNEGDSVEEKEIIKQLRFVCGNYGLPLPEREGLLWSFSHCIKGGELKCYCLVVHLLSTLATLDKCSSDTTLVNNNCVRTVQT